MSVLTISHTIAERAKTTEAMGLLMDEWQQKHNQEPLKMVSNGLHSLTEKIIELTAKIDKQRKSLESQQSCWGKQTMSSVIKWGSYTASAACTVGASVEFARGDFNDTESLVILTSNLIGAVFFAVIGYFTQQQQNALEKENAELQSLRDDELQVKIFHTFLTSLKEFEKTKAPEDLKCCICELANLHKFPKDTNYKRSLKIEQIASGLIKALPETNPLKTVVKDLYHMAIDRSPSSETTDKENIGVSQKNEKEDKSKEEKTKEANTKITLSSSASSDKNAGFIRCSSSGLVDAYGTKWKEFTKGLGHDDILHIEWEGIVLKPTWDQTEKDLTPRAIMKTDQSPKSSPIKLEQSPRSSNSIQMTPVSSNLNKQAVGKPDNTDVIINISSDSTTKPIEFSLTSPTVMVKA